MGNAAAIEAHPSFIGLLDTILVDADSTSYIAIDSGATLNNTTWKFQPVPYFVKGYVDIDSAVTIEEGNTFLMDADAEIAVVDDYGSRFVPEVLSFKNNLFTAMNFANAIEAEPEAFGQLETILVDEGSINTQILINSGSVKTDTTWVKQPVQLIIETWLDVWATLNIKVGEVRLNTNENIEVNDGALNIYSTKFTTNKLDKKWGHILYLAESSSSEIKDSQFISGGFNGDGVLIFREGSITLDNVSFSDIGDCDYSADDNSSVTMKNMTILPQECVDPSVTWFLTPFALKAHAAPEIIPLL